MKITTKVHDTAAIPARTITIEIEPGDDVNGEINELVTRGWLEAFLRVYGNAHIQPEGKRDLDHLLASVGSVSNVAAQRLTELMWCAKDTYRMSWRPLAAMVHQPPTTIRRRVAKWRRSYADHGDWRDHGGMHHTTVDEAHAVADAYEKTEATSTE